MPHRNLTRLLSIAVLIAMSLAATPPSGAKVLKGARWVGLSAVYGQRFVDESQACLYDAVKQGLSVKQAFEQCDQKMDVKVESGGLTAPGGGPLVHGGTAGFGGFDITSDSVVSACKNVDPKVANGSSAGGMVEDDDLAPLPTGNQREITRLGQDITRLQGKIDDAEKAAKGAQRDADLADATAKAAAASARAAEDEKKEPGKSDEELTKEAKERRDAAIEAEKKKAAEAQTKADEAAKKAEEAKAEQKRLEQEKEKKEKEKKEKEKKEKEAKSNSNNKRTAQEESCQEKMAAARAFLEECKRTQFKGEDCEKINNCPMSQMYVDPDQGFACHPAVDAEALKDAYVRRCKQNTTPGPDGASPCDKVSVGEGGAFILGANPNDLCSPGNPYAYIDPGSGLCISSIGEPKLPKGPKNTGLEWVVIFPSTHGGPAILLPKVGRDLNAPPADPGATFDPDVQDFNTVGDLPLQ